MFLFFSLYTLITFLPSRATNTLPGLDVLSSGYDAASWTSKARIFDLDDEATTQFVTSIGKTYTSPAYVSVVTHGAHSKRTETSCSGIYSYFSDYVHQRQSSVSFDVGVSLGVFKLGIAYNKDVRSVYHAITTKRQSIGLSESWWGIYEASLPPAFLMTSKFTKTFNMTIARLKQIGVPKNEAEQQIYNQVCCGAGGFGTHYVGSIIAGGRAKVTSFINNTYHKAHSTQTATSQLSLHFQFMKYNLSGDFSKHTKDVLKKLTVDFKNNTNFAVSYQPDMKEIHQSKTPWLSWEKSVASNPVVVNQTASSLANLFIDSPRVMQHMQKTIDFYIRLNKPPRLSQLRNLLASNSVPTFTKTVPGLDVVGCGFDAPTLTSKRCLFKTPSVNLPKSQWSNPYYPDIVYNVPYGFFVTNTPDSLLLNGSVMINSIDDLVRKSFYETHHHSSGFLGFGSRDEYHSTRKYYRNLYARNYKLVLSLQQIGWYTLRLIEFPLPLFKEDFRKALDFLPSVYDPNNARTVSLFQMFFSSFGTDVVSEAHMGGLVWAENWYEGCLSKMYSETCIKETSSRGWWFVHSHSHHQSCTKREQHSLNESFEKHFELLGGTSAGKIKEKDWAKWLLSVKYDPRPVRYTLVPLHYLLYDSNPKKEAIKAATHAYLKKSQDNRDKVIDSLKAVRRPPSSRCKKINKRVAFTNMVVNMFADMN